LKDLAHAELATMPQFLGASFLSYQITNAPLKNRFTEYFKFLHVGTFAVKRLIMPLLDCGVESSVNRLEDWQSTLCLCFHVECDRPSNHHFGPFPKHRSVLKSDLYLRLCGIQVESRLLVADHSKYYNGNYPQ
jgi:hypothetical protein